MNRPTPAPPLPDGAFRHRAPAPERIVLQAAVGGLAAVLAYVIRDLTTHGQAAGSLTNSAVTGVIVAITATLAVQATAWTIAHTLEAWREPGTGRRIRWRERRHD